ncbi:MAG: excinuclease ABC subunit UvrA [Verrucomicrobiota bacterium]
MNDQSKIRVVGAYQHNLKNLTLEIPKHELVVITGPSGSGKSSLAFDTLYAEGQRRYVQSLSSYARQFIDQLEKPAVERIEGLAPAIAIEQRKGTSGGRSTIATSTEISDYLRLLFAEAGQAYHPQTGKKLEKWTIDQIADEILSHPDGQKFFILAPLVNNEKGRHAELLERLKSDGFVRARMNGKVALLDQLPPLEAKKAHSIEVVVDRLKVSRESTGRMMDSLELGLRLGKHVVHLLWLDEAGHEEIEAFSDRAFDPDSGTHFPVRKARDFSFNHPSGACPTCHGLGKILRADASLVVPDPHLSLEEDAIAPWKRGNKGIAAQYKSLARDLCRHGKVDMATPWEDLPEPFHELVLYGSRNKDDRIERTSVKKGEMVTRFESFEGVIPMVERLYAEAKSPLSRRRMQSFMNEQTCPRCQGARLRPEILAIVLEKNNGNESLNIHEFTNLPISKALDWITDYTPPHEALNEVVNEIRQRLQFLNQVGLGYLCLDRQTSTLSGGEFQRIRLATQIGSALTDVLYVLDEPSIGLHQRDQERLLESLVSLRDLGNSVIVVEHDEDTMRLADWIIDLGPAAGPHGGKVMGLGTPDQLAANPNSPTGRYLAGAETISLPKNRIKAGPDWIHLKGASEHNLKAVNASIPLHTLTCVTGVSGSGKSTLINRVLGKAIFRHLYQSKEAPGQHEGIDGLELIDRAVIVDQKPIGRTPRSNPATYTGIFDEIRSLFAGVPASRIRGYTKSRFSFNTPGGRCETCQGDGLLKIEMNFLPDAYVTCDSCLGLRFNRETLEITYRSHTIADVLNLTISEAMDLFANHTKLSEKLTTLHRVGLGYLKLGQPANTLSGGEAQRVKLASELSRNRPDHTLFLLDEPTTGLHFGDIEQLLSLLFSLRDSNNTLLVIEHHLDVIKCADYVIDLGPEGGDKGGEIVATGTPEEIAANPKSITGQFLAEKIGGTALPSKYSNKSSEDLFS